MSLPANGNEAQQGPPAAGGTPAGTALLRRVGQSGDAEAFRALFEAYAPRIKAYMLRQGADAALAEDLAQETLLAVWRKARLYSEGRGSVTAWIFAIARNLRIDRLRKEMPWQELPQEEIERPADGGGPHEAVLEAERCRGVQAALARLPPEQYEAVLLSYIEGLPHAEIAARLGVPPGTVKSRMRLAYHKLREAIKDLR